MIKKKNSEVIIEGVQYIQFYFWAVPVGQKFRHKGEVFIKLNDTDGLNVIDENGDKWRFESHYGCLIDKKTVHKIGLKEGVRVG